MHPVLAVVAASVLGLEVGWKPLDEGGVEYIIQIHPDQVERILNSDDLLSDVPAGLDVRRYRVTVGTEKLPRDSGRAGSAAAKSREIPVEQENPPDVTRVAKKEIVAEGNIPPTAAAPLLPNVELPKAAADDNATGPAERADESAGPELPTTETTVNKPAVTGYDGRYPSPQDEEETQPTETFRNPPPAEETPARDRLFTKPNNSPLRPRLFDDPSETDRPRRPASTARSFSEEEFDQRTQEARKPPANSDVLRTAELPPASRDSGFDRSTREPENWGPLLAIFFFLLLSMGANLWLGWIALEARHRYQILLDKYRSVGGKSTVELA